ncbi:MAG: PIN domain-containing protein [Polyangiaceae bacterium]
MSEKVFLDSGILIAFLNGRDRFHIEAKALFSLAKPRWSTSFLVVSETYSWFLHRHGEEAARSFRALLDSLESLRIFSTDAEHHTQVLRMLDRLRGAKLTYVDASSLALMERNKIRTVWATDHHLGLTGAEVLPRG